MSLSRKLSPLLAASAALTSLAACGARTELGVATISTSATASSPGSSGAPPEDPCPSAVAGPKAMFGSCSTRDGRSRVGAPTSPHLTWQTKLPTDATGHLGLSELATDATNHAYVVTTDNFDDVGQVRRVSLSDGSIDWTTTIAPDSATSTPVVLAKGAVDLFAYGAASKESLLSLDPAMGTATATTFGLDLYYGPPNPAVGADGSLYFVHSTDVGGANTQTFLSRIGPDGVVAWTSVDLATLGPPPENPGSWLSASTVALGEGDLAIVVANAIAKSGDVSQVMAFEPATGAARWSTSIAGQLVGGPAVGPGGAIVLLASDGSAQSLVVLEPHSGGATKHPLATSAFEIFAISPAGVVLAGTDAGQGIDGLVAISGDGSTLWQRPGAVRAATLAADGTIFAFGPTLIARDPVTGDPRWELAPPAPASCIADAALTSAGAIVALQCSGILFGAGD